MNPARLPRPSGGVVATVPLMEPTAVATARSRGNGCHPSRVEATS